MLCSWCPYTLMVRNVLWKVYWEVKGLQLWRIWAFPPRGTVLIHVWCKDPFPGLEYHLLTQHFTWTADTVQKSVLVPGNVGGPTLMAKMIIFFSPMLHSQIKSCIGDWITWPPSRPICARPKDADLCSSSPLWPEMDSLGQSRRQECRVDGTGLELG